MNSMRFTTTNIKTANQHFYVNSSTSKPMDIDAIHAQTRPQYVNARLQGQVAAAPIVEKKEKPEFKKMKWGEPIWFLFHTLAHKVKEEHFAQIRTELLNNIYNICNNLPCPMCATHATEYMNKVNFKTISKKQDLKDLLFVFHNNVNERKGFDMFLYADLDKKYDTANTRNIIYNFINAFQDKHKSIHMIANDMYRKRLVAILKEWFNANIQYFDP